MDERAVDELRRLADLDALLGARATHLRELDREVGALRARAGTIEAFFANYPEEQGRRAGELRAAEDELLQRRAELAGAETTLAESQDEEATVHARHAVARALDHIAVTEGRLARAQAAHDELEHDATALPRELAELEVRARALPDVPPLGRSLAEWASHAHAELFVAAGQVDIQRERVIREAHELATMLLGEPTYGATLARVLARVDAQRPSA